MASLAVTIPAAGSSTRFGDGRNKLLEPLSGDAVLVRSIRAFAQRKDVSAIIVATSIDPAAWASLGRRMAGKITTCMGGQCRAESVLNALRAVPSEIEWVAVHDAARPLVSQAMISRTFAAAVERGAAAPALPVALTVKQAQGPLPARVERTLPRHTLWAMQTPQVAGRAALLDAFERCTLPLDQVTDDAQVLELAGKDVWLIEGEERNLKITTRQDMQLAELILAARRTAQI